jgi:hypothetical protein
MGRKIGGLGVTAWATKMRAPYILAKAWAYGNAALEASLKSVGKSMLLKERRRLAWRVGIETSSGRFGSPG